MAKAEKILYGFIIFSVILIVGIMMINDLNVGYADVDIENEEVLQLQNKSSFLHYTSNYNNTGEVSNLQNLSSDQREAVLENELGETDLSITKGSYKVYRMLKEAGPMVFNTISYVGQVLHIPPILTIAGMTAFLIFIIFVIVNMALRLFRG